MNETKIKFIKNDFTDLLQQLQPEQKGKWGLMNAHQMVGNQIPFFSVVFAQR